VIWSSQLFHNQNKVSRREVSQLIEQTNKKTTRYTIEAPVKLWALIAQERALTGKTTNQIIIERLTESYDEVFPLDDYQQ